MTRTQGLIGFWGAAVASLSSFQIHTLISLGFLLVATLYLYAMTKTEKD